jgi:hypothetical protein
VSGEWNGRATVKEKLTVQKEEKMKRKLHTVCYIFLMTLLNNDRYDLFTSTGFVMMSPFYFLAGYIYERTKPNALAAEAAVTEWKN